MFFGVGRAALPAAKPPQAIAMFAELLARNPACGAVHRSARLGLLHHVFMIQQALAVFNRECDASCGVLCFKVAELDGIEDETSVATILLEPQATKGRNSSAISSVLIALPVGISMTTSAQLRTMF